MAYDSNFPIEHTEIRAEQFREQFHGIKDLIDAVPTITGAVVDGVSTLDPGAVATVSLAIVGGVLHVGFGIPRGDVGAVGADGATGGTGPQGPPFGNAVVDGVNTLPSGAGATVGVTFDGTNVRFTFGIPTGFTGAEGGQGPQGAPGEVSNAQLSSAITGAVAAVTADSSANSNGVALMDTAFTNDPPTPDDMELLRVKINELINALRR